MVTSTRTLPQPVRIIIYSRKKQNKIIILILNRKHFKFTEPVSQLVLNGTKWFQADDQLELDMYCTGSPNFEYCMRQLNHTNDSNETCDNWTSIKDCHQHFSLKPIVGDVKAFAILILVRNSVSVERGVHIVMIKQPIYMVASVVGCAIFILIIILTAVYCIVRCIRQKET